MTLELPLQKFYQREKETPYKTFLKQSYRGKWKDLMWSEVSQQVRSMATFLMLQQFSPGSNIAIHAKNSAYWIMADLAIWLSGHVSVPFYPNLDGPGLKSLIQHSEAQLIFLEKGKNWETIKDYLPKSLPKVFFPPHQEKLHFLWEKICLEHKPFNQNIFRKGDEVATIIYTSGTTGLPKGVMHTFSSFAIGAKNILDLVNPKGDQHFFSYLPLAHVAERSLIEVGSLYVNATISFLENKNTFENNLKKVKPTVFLAVPFVWETIQSKILEKIPQQKLDFLLKIPFLKSYIKLKIKKSLGFSKIQYAFTGAASIKKELLLWFNELDIPIIECYGMTENLSYSHGNFEAPEFFGSVGKAYPNVEVKLGQEGEILINSPCNLKGYYKDPEQTLEKLQGSFFKTGDIGKIDKGGHLTITGRVKDIFKTSKGKYVSPSPIENLLSHTALIKQICLVGDSLSQPMALTLLNVDFSIHTREEINKELLKEMESVNKKLPSYEKIQKIIVLKETWTEDNGLLTPTLKIKRNKLEAKFKKFFQKWYNLEDIIVWEE